MIWSAGSHFHAGSRGCLWCRARSLPSSCRSRVAFDASPVCQTGGFSEPGSYPRSDSLVFRTWYVGDGHASWRGVGTGPARSSPSPRGLGLLCASHLLGMLSNNHEPRELALRGRALSPPILDSTGLSPPILTIPSSSRVTAVYRKAHDATKLPGARRAHLQDVCFPFEHRHLSLDSNTS